MNLDLILYMNIQAYIYQIRKNDAKDIGLFLLDPEGFVVTCNVRACQIFKYKSPDDVSGLSYKKLVPDEFAVSLPDQITLDYLTNGQFLPRVNKCADGTLISTFVKTEYVTLDNVSYVETTVLLNNESIHIGELRYKQLSELLQCELHLLKTREKVSDDKYINTLLQIRLAEYPLTCKEIQFCSLLHSGMHTKEIADILNQTIESMYKFRKRLRKKLNLDPKEDLYLFLQRISKS